MTATSIEASTNRLGAVEQGGPESALQGSTTDCGLTIQAHSNSTCTKAGSHRWQPCWEFMRLVPAVVLPSMDVPSEAVALTASLSRPSPSVL